MWFVLWTIGCAADPLPAGWAALELPVEDGEITKAERGMLQVDYREGADLQEVARAWVTALEAKGLHAGAPTVGTGETSFVYEISEPGRPSWTLAVVRLNGQVEVHLSGMGYPGAR